MKNLYLCLWNMAWQTYKTRSVQRMIHGESIALWRIACKKKMRESVFMIASRSCWNFTMVEKRVARKELMPYCMQKALDWIKYGGRWKSFLYEFDLCVWRAMKVYKELYFEIPLCLSKKKVQRSYKMCTTVTWQRNSKIEYRCTDVCKRGPLSDP